MKIHHILFLAAIMLAGQLANAQSPIKNEANKKHGICVNSGAGVPTQLAFLSCITAFDALITEAQKTKQHAADQQRLFWAQAGQSAGLALILQVKIDNAKTTEAALTTKVCRLALRGLQAYSQIKLPANKSEAGSIFSPSDYDSDGIFGTPDYMINVNDRCNAKKAP